ncbi:hypothetical protein DK870_29665, partial [Pseudomonas sp. Q1]|nr:hypothetical protein [Pseudomonas sp. Q1]
MFNWLLKWKLLVSWLLNRLLKRKLWFRLLLNWLLKWKLLVSWLLNRLLKWKMLRNLLVTWLLNWLLKRKLLGHQRLNILKRFTPVWNSLTESTNQ